MTSPTAFLGLSHLGVVSSIGWASFGAPVIAVDLDRDVVEMLQRGELPVHEPSLEDCFGQARDRISFSFDPSAIRECSLVVIARDVPTDAADTSELSVVDALIDAALPHLPQDVTLAVMSQVPAGFARRLRARLHERRPDLRATVVCWVETLIFGRAVERFLRPERIIIGCADPSAALPDALASGLARFHCPIVKMSYESAELTKTAINLYLCAAVSYANTMSDLCEAVGADWSEMMPALRLDARIGPAAYIAPGMGIAGGNLERDMVTLKNLCTEHGLDGSFITAMLDYNSRRRQWVHRRLAEHLFPYVEHPVVAVWGLAYKRNTLSTKNSMSLRIIDDLAERVEIRAHDPLVGAVELPASARLVASAGEALIGADCLLVLTDWEQFAVPPRHELAAMRRPLVIDAVGIVDRRRADLDGVTLVSMGRAG